VYCKEQSTEAAGLSFVGKLVLYQLPTLDIYFKRNCLPLW